MNTAAMPARTGPLSAGDQFLKFEIRGLLGQGGHGWVYHGYDPFLDRHVAIKVIPNPADRGRDLGRRAQLEARVLCKLQHQNVVHVIDAGASSEGAVYIVMELLYGRTLRDAIRDYRQLSVAEVLSLGAQIADGVQAAHGQSAIHRDLKPENVFVLRGNAVKVLDFGIAKFLGAGAATTQRDLLHGTILYMSPEHLQGFRVTPRSDIYALGTTLYEALAGRPPCLIGMEEPTLEAVTFAQINRMPTPLDVLTPTVPRFVARAIQRMLAKEPADRFATMAEVAQVLRAHWQRFVSEGPEGNAAARDLWRGTHSLSPTSGAILSSRATTDVHELGPTTSPPVGARPFRAADTATPLQFSPAPAIRSVLPSPTPRLPSAPVYSARTPLLQPREETPPPETEPVRARAELSQAPTPSITLPLPQLLLSAVALGTLVGLAVGLLQGVPRSALPAATVSANARRSLPPPPVPDPEPARATPAAAVAHEAASAPAASVALSTPHPPVAPKRTHKALTIRPTSGPADAASEPSTKLESAAPPLSNSAKPIRRPRAIYGSDDGSE